MVVVVCMCDRDNIKEAMKIAHKYRQKGADFQVPTEYNGLSFPCTLQNL